MRDLNHLKNSPPGGWDHWNAEQLAEDRKAERLEESKKIKGEWFIVEKYPGGSICKKGPMPYYKALIEIDEARKLNTRFALKHRGLGKFNPSYEIEEASKGEHRGQEEER